MVEIVYTNLSYYKNCMCKLVKKKKKPKKVFD